MVLFSYYTRIGDALPTGGTASLGRQSAAITDKIEVVGFLWYFEVGNVLTQHDEDGRVTSARLEEKGRATQAIPRSSLVEYVYSRLTGKGEE